MRGFFAPVEAAEARLRFWGLPASSMVAMAISSLRVDAQHFAIDKQCLERLRMIVEVAQCHDEFTCSGDMHAGAMPVSMVVLAFS